MLFGQLLGQGSLRGIEAGLATQASSLYHMGIKPIHRSTLAYANKHRSHELFKKLFLSMLSKCRRIAPKHPLKFKNPLYSLDAGDVVVFDKGYNDFAWYKSLDDKGVYFVTRLKENADYTVVQRKNTDDFQNIYSDQTIKPQGFYTRQKYPKKLRRIRSKDPETGKIIVLLTNNFKWSTETIAKIYKERWQIELFFKAIKQNLKVKIFVGTSENALLSQLWIALIAYLLLSYLKFKSKFKWSIYTLCCILPANLLPEEIYGIGSMLRSMIGAKRLHLYYSRNSHSANLDSSVVIAGINGLKIVPF